MNLDVRLPMGLMFVLLGGLLAVYGLASDRAAYAKSLGINVNLWWGLVIFALGILFLFLGWMSRRRADFDPPPDTAPPHSDDPGIK